MHSTTAKMTKMPRRRCPHSNDNCAAADQGPSQDHNGPLSSRHLNACRGCSGKPLQIFATRHRPDDDCIRSGRIPHPSAHHRPLHHQACPTLPARRPKNKAVPFHNSDNNNNNNDNNNNNNNDDDDDNNNNDNINR